MPRLQRAGQRELHAGDRTLADAREAEGEVRREPGRVEGEASMLQVGDHVVEIHAVEGRQQEGVVHCGAPTREARRTPTLVRRAPEPGDQRAQQQLLREAHARMRRHLEGAQLEQAEAPGAAVGRVQLVDAELGAVRVAGGVHQQVAQRAVDQPRRTFTAQADLPLDLLQREFDFIDLIGARFIDARMLARRPDEQAREQIRQRRVVLPIREQAGEHVGTTQERAVGGRRAAEHEVVAAAGAGVAAIDHELLGRQARLPRGLVEKFGVLDEFAPVVRRVDVDFDDARVRRDGERLQPRVARRGVAFEHDLQLALGRSGLDGREQLQPIVERLQRRHEDVQQTGLRRRLVEFDARAVRTRRIAHFDDERRAHDVPGLGARRFACSDETLTPRQLREQRRMLAQRRARRERVLLDDVRIVLGLDPRQRRQRQAVAHRRIPGQQQQRVAAHRPRAADPIAALALRQWQQIADDLPHPLPEDAAQSCALQFVVELRIRRADVHRQPPFAPKVVADIFMPRLHVLHADAQALRERGAEALRVGAGVAQRLALVGEQGRIVPARLTVGAPADRQRPARQLLARVPLALAEVQEAALPVVLAQLQRECLCKAALRRAERRGVPFGRFAVVDRNERRLTAHRQAHVALLQFAIDCMAERDDAVPLRVGVRQRDAR
jgi:hypothetical protein